VNSPPHWSRCCHDPAHVFFICPAPGSGDGISVTGGGAQRIGHGRARPGATLATAPAEIRLTFSEPLATGSTFQLFGENFLPVSGISAAIDPESPEQLVAAVPSLLPGDYTVQWTSVAHDGDILSGSYSFTLLAEAQKGTGALVWITAAAGGLALAAGLAWLYRRRRIPTGEKT